MFGRSLPCYIGGSEQVISARLIQVLPGNWGGVRWQKFLLGPWLKLPPGQNNHTTEAQLFLNPPICRNSMRASKMIQTCHGHCLLQLLTLVENKILLSVEL